MVIENAAVNHASEHTTSATAIWLRTTTGTGGGASCGGWSRLW